MTPQLLRMALVLGLLSTIGPFAIDMYLPALPRIALDLEVPEATVQFTLTSYFIAFGIAQLFYGPASDMFGRKPPIYAGLIVFALASIGCALAPDAQTLIVLRFVQGLGAAGIMSIPRAIVRDRHTGPEATRLMSTIILVIAISPMLAPLVGSLIVVPFGWRAIFVAVTAAAFVGLALNMFALEETLPREKRVRFNLFTTLKHFAILFKDTNYLGLSAIGGLGMAAFFTYLGSSSFIYMEYFSLSPTQFSIAFAAGAAGFFIASQFAANAMRRFGPTRLIRGATLGFMTFNLALLLLFATGFGSLYLLVAMITLSNIFMGFIMPSAMVLSLEDHGAIAGAASSLAGTIQMALGATAMVFGGLFYNGTPFPMLIIMSLCAVGTFAIAIIAVKPMAPQIVRSTS